jgi:hypothetical protein
MPPLAGGLGFAGGNYRLRRQKEASRKDGHAAKLLHSLRVKSG